LTCHREEKTNLDCVCQAYENGKSWIKEQENKNPKGGTGRGHLACCTED
jgi:hypothetical protein